MAFDVQSVYFRFFYAKWETKTTNNSRPDPNEKMNSSAVDSTPTNIELYVFRMHAHMPAESLIRLRSLFASNSQLHERPDGLCVENRTTHTHTSASTRSRRTRRLMAFGRTSHQHMNGVTASAEPTMIFYYFITRDLSMRGARLRVCSIIFLCSGTRFYYSISHEPLRIGFRAWIWWKTAARFCRSEKPCKTQRNYTEVSGISSTIVVGWEWLHDEDGKEYDDDVRV